MITELRAQNFKSWEDTGALHFAPLTGLFGANSTGKTSILQVLLLLKQTVERPSAWSEPLYFGDDESLVNLGSFDDVIYQHRQDLSLDISVSWKPLEDIHIVDLRGLGIPINVEVQKLTAGEWGPAQAKNITFSTNINRSSLKSVYYETPQYKFQVEGPGGVFRCYGFRYQARGGAQELFSNFEEAFENLFSSIRYLGPLREHPRPHYVWEGDHPEGIGQYGEKAVAALLSGRINRLSVDEQILKWLQQLELIDSYHLQPVANIGGNYEFRVKKHKDGPEVRLTDVGFGISQVLPVLILCYYVPEGGILILEQPEAHLHPKVQADLVDVFIDVVKNRNVQVILESHSEHLLMRLMRRTAEEQISVDDTALYFCQINDGTSAIERLKMDEYGNISNWPQNFFGDEMGDLAAKAKAEIQRKKRNK